MGGGYPNDFSKGIVKDRETTQKNKAKIELKRAPYWCPQFKGEKPQHY